jgi:phage-related minor tail protein
VAKLAAEWAKMFLQRGIDALLGPAFSAIFPGTVAASARGNVISAGRVVPFARGGVVDRPTVFPMRSGAGLMGERGPEAILPLRRGGDGKLGVAGGRVRVDISLNNAMLEARTTTTAKGVAVGVLRRYDRAMPQRVSEIARDPRKR